MAFHRNQLRFQILGEDGQPGSSLAEGQRWDRTTLSSTPVLGSPASVNIPYCQEDVRFWKRIDQQTGYTTRSMLCGPLCDRDGSLVGVVQFLNKRGGIFTGQDEELLLSMSGQVADLLEETTLGRGPDFARHRDPEARESSAGLGDQFNRIIGVGEAMRSVFRTVRKVAPTGPRSS
jgi:GAF domain-containing protein